MERAENSPRSMGRCGWVCDNCVNTSGFFSAKYECRNCGKKVLSYEFDGKKNKWVQS